MLPSCRCVDQLGVDRRRICIRDDQVGLEERAVLEQDTLGPAVGNLDALDRRVETHVNADFAQQTRQSAHDGRCAAHREMDAPFALQPVNQKVDAGRAERVPANEQRLERENLA